MPKTYDPIMTTTLSSAVSNVTLSSIPNIYTDLVFVFSGSKSEIANTFMRINADSNANYSQTSLYAASTTPTSNRYSNASFLYVDLAGGNANAIHNRILQFNNYSNTTTYKTILIKENNANADGESLASVGLWRSTSAINSIRLEVTNGSFNIGSSFTLYGIKAA